MLFFFNTFFYFFFSFALTFWVYFDLQKIILPSPLSGIESTTFPSRIRRSSIWATSNPLDRKRNGKKKKQKKTETWHVKEEYDKILIILHVLFNYSDYFTREERTCLLLLITEQKQKTQNINFLMCSYKPGPILMTFPNFFISTVPLKIFALMRKHIL